MHSIIFLDIAAVAIFLVLANLSRRLGVALKLPAYYKLFFAAVACVGFSMFIDAVTLSNAYTILIKHSVSMIITMVFRFMAGGFAVFACLKYWQWLIAELFKK